MPRISRWRSDTHLKHSWTHGLNVELDTANIALALWPIFKIKLHPYFNMIELRVANNIQIIVWYLFWISSWNIALALRSTFKIQVNTHFEFLAGCREYRAGSEIAIQTIVKYTFWISSWRPEILFWVWDQHSNYSQINILNIELDSANIALYLRSTFKIYLSTYFEYRAGCREYRAGSEINIQNISKYTFWISSWFSRLSHWLWDQHAKYTGVHSSNIELDAANIAKALSSTIQK